MYGFSGYGTNSYGSERQSSFLAQVIQLGGRVFSGLYGAALTFQRFNSARTFADPQNESQTFQLPPA